jgi:hypothetical protein
MPESVTRAVAGHVGSWAGLSSLTLAIAWIKNSY